MRAYMNFIIITLPIQYIKMNHYYSILHWDTDNYHSKVYSKKHGIPFVYTNHIVNLVHDYKVRILLVIFLLCNRVLSKNITSNMKGEGLVQGGIIIFNKVGVARYAYREETGSELPIDDILLALQAVRDEDMMEEDKQMK